MDAPGIESRMALPEITRTYQRTIGAWAGCDWAVRFGKLGLNLNGLKSAQADLMAGATAGEESAEWRRAAKWLARLEQDAQRAETCGRTAVDLVSRQNLHQALESAEAACRIEAKYHVQLVWQALRDSIAAHLNGMG
jgi:hypothetical protein